MQLPLDVVVHARDPAAAELAAAARLAAARLAAACRAFLRLTAARCAAAFDALALALARAAAAADADCSAALFTGDGVADEAADGVATTELEVIDAPELGARFGLSTPSDPQPASASAPSAEAATNPRDKTFRKPMPVPRLSDCREACAQNPLRTTAGGPERPNMF